MKWTWVQNKPRLCIWVKLFVKKENEKQHLMDQLLGLMNVFGNSDVSLYPGCCFKLTLQALNTAATNSKVTHHHSKLCQT